MSPPGCQKMSAKPCNRNAEKSFPVLSLKSREQKPPNPLLIQDKNVLQPSARLCTPLLDGRLSGVHHGVADALWAVGAACAPPGHRASPEAALDATAPAPLCASGQDRAAPASGTGAPPRGVRHPGGGPAGLSGLRLADQHGVH